MRTEDRTDDAYRNALIQQERTGAGIWDLILSQMNADADAIHALREREAAEAREATQLRGIVAWNLSQYERWKADMIDRHDARMRDEIDRHERLRVIGQRVVNAHRERRKVVRVADMMGGES